MSKSETRKQFNYLDKTILVWLCRTSRRCWDRHFLFSRTLHRQRHRPFMCHSCGCAAMQPIPLVETYEWFTWYLVYFLDQWILGSCRLWLWSEPDAGKQLERRCFAKASTSVSHRAFVFQTLRQDVNRRLFMAPGHNATLAHCSYNLFLPILLP